jgi:uncharacterized repeat protein (TIGR01451 family)
VGSGRRGILVAVMALILAVNNGAFAALGFMGVNSPSSSALALVSGPTAAVQSVVPSVTFVDYAQCANGAPPSTSTACPDLWINGILNANNSHYHEGDVTAQRAEVSYPAGAAFTGATMTFKYQSTKGGIHAYDSLATWNYTQTTANKNQDLNAADVVNAPTSTLPMTSDLTAAAHELPAANRVWTMYGGTLTSSSAVTHDCTTSTTQCTGDDYGTVTVTYSVPASTSTRNVQLLFGGHLAVSTGPLGWGAGLGSASVSGGPYHIKWDLADGASIGQRDNQIMASAIIPAPALSITKSGCATVAAGGTCSYSILVNNTGTASASGVVVTDTLPTGLTPTSATWGASATACGISGQTVTCNIGTVAASSSVTVTVNVTAGAAACGTVTNTATLNATGQTQQQSSTTTQIQCASLSITKTTSTSSVALGGAATFTITVTNNANATLTATGVTISDTLPAGFTYASGTSGGTGTRTATTNPTAGQTILAWGTWSLAPGQTATATFTATAPNSCGSYNNNAGYTSTNAGSGSTTSPATVTVTGCAPSLSITKTTSTSSVALGGAATFTITVTNSASATATATGVTISDTLPTGFTFASGTSGGTGTRTATSNPTAGQTTLAWGTWSLAPGQTATATFTATAPSAANSCGTYDNNAGYASTNAGSGSTSSPATVTVTGCTGNLSITKTTSTATVVLGGAATFTITVTNNANATLTATGVTISDTLPSGFTYASTGAAGGTGTRTSTTNPTAGDTDLTFGTWSLAPGQTASVTFTATAPSAADSCGAYNNNASVGSGNDGSASTTSPATVTVVCPDVRVLKTAGQAISAGGTASFTILVTAGGSGDSTQVMLTDDLAAGLTWSKSGTDAGACTITGTLLACNFGTMTNGSSRTVTLTATTSSANCPSITNTALVSAEVDTDVTNDSSTAIQTVNCGAISLTKTADNASVTAGTAIGFIITATNNGAGTATSTTVSDTLPTTAGTSWTIDTLNSDAGCSITTGTLTCTFGDLASKASKHVHVTSPTTLASCGTVTNDAIVRTGNAGNSEASASLTVNCPPAPQVGLLQVTKYNDTNRNGTRDAGEPGLQGFVFTVKSGGVTVATLSSDANGMASAGNMPAGTYTITETQQTGWTSTDPGTSLTKTASVSVGQTTTVLFGNAAVQLPPTSAGTLVVTKYNDLNANKTRDTNEPALSGWMFTVKDASGATVGSVATDANGNAIFSNVAFGTYTVTETLQAGWTSTDPGGATPTKTVTINAANTTVLFGNAQIKLPNTSTAEAPASPSPAMLFLLGVLLLQGLLITLVFRRWRND